MPSSILRDAQRRQLRVAGITRASVAAALRKTTQRPKAIEISYAGFLVSGQRSVNAKIREALEAMGSILARADSVYDIVVEPAVSMGVASACTVRADDLNDDIARAFAALRATVTGLTAATEGVLVLGIVDHSSKTVAFNAEKYNSPPMQLLGIGNASEGVERSIVRGWVRENVQLVANMNAEQVGKLETLFLRALRDGTRSSQLRADVDAILGDSVNRARLIARDQIGKLNGQLDRQKQTEAGVESYTWRGTLSSRERPGHVAREGDIFRWADPPPDAGGGSGHPGQPVQCQCTAEPNLAPLLGEEFATVPNKPTAAERKRLEIERVRNNRRQAQKRRKRAARAARSVAS